MDLWIECLAVAMQTFRYNNTWGALTIFDIEDLPPENVAAKMRAIEEIRFIDLGFVFTGDMAEVCDLRALSAGMVTVTRLPDRFGESKQLWWARSPNELVSGWQLSSAKERMVREPLVRRYLQLVRADGRP
jgi:hypothetical protein